MKSTVILVGSLIVATIVGCKSGQSAGSETAASGSASGSGSIGGEGKRWQEKTRQERVDWMGIEVFPKMKALFVEYDAKGFEDFKCQTCHGETMEMLDFSMPGVIYALSASDPVGEAREYDAEMTAFMTDVVLPEMAALLNTTPYDPATQTGLGCFDCHPADE